ncbi:MAG: hypothetical protein ACOY40_14265 [Bacillota bacterium]
MKKSKIWLLLFCFIFFGIACSASAGSLIPAKQLLIARLQSTDFGYDDSFKKSSGTVSCELQNVSGSMVPPDDKVVKVLAGAKLSFDYKLNVPEKKLEMNYQLNARKDSYRGSIFINNDKIILSKEVLLLLSLVDPKALDTAEYSALPPYGYLAGREIAKLWDVALNPDVKDILPAYRELLVFIAEAVPDKYFTTSLADQKIIFHLDQEGLADVIFAVMQKVRGEKERFAELVARLVVLSDPAENAEAVKAEVISGIEEGIRNGAFPGSPGEVQKSLSGVFELEDMIFEVPFLPSGKSRFTLVANLGGNSQFTGKISVDASFAGSKENYKGAYDIVFSGREKRQDISGRIMNEFEKTGPDSKNNGLVRCKMTDLNGTKTLLDLSVLFDSNARAGENVPVNIPRLTESNSVNITEYRGKIS